MKQWKIFSAALLACCSITLSSQAVAEIKILDRVVAIVDDDIVLLSELEQRITAVYAQIQQSDTQPPPPEVLRPQVLERLISERLQLTMGYNAGIRITDAELNEALGRIAGNAGMSSSDYLQAIQQQGSNVSAMREQIRHEMILMRVQQGQVMRRIRISPQELDNFLESEEGRF